MKRPWLTGGLATAALLLGLSHPAAAQPFSESKFVTFLTGYEEVPPTSTTGKGNVTITISPDGTSISYELSYSGMSSTVTQAHIHFGERPVNGGIMVFLCDNLGTAPAGVPACPASGTVSGTIQASDVNPPLDPEPVTAQGIAAGDLAGVVAAIKHGDAYANVHSTDFPSGEIRGWLRPPFPF
jgi:hypothetical protein